MVNKSVQGTYTVGSVSISEKEAQELFSYMKSEEIENYLSEHPEIKRDKDLLKNLSWLAETYEGLRDELLDGMEEFLMGTLLLNFDYENLLEEFEDE